MNSSSGLARWTFTHKLKIAVFFLVVSLQMCFSPAFSATYTGNLIQITVSDAPEFGMMVDVRPPSTPSAPFVRQYFHLNSWGTAIYFANGSTTHAYSSSTYDGTNFTQVSNSVSTTATGGTITSVETLGSTGLTLTQTVNYENGNNFITKTWQLTNTGATTYTELKLFHGGDTFFGGEDFGYGFYNSAQGMVYLRNSSTTTWGIMGFYANPATPSSAYHEGLYIENENQIKNIRQLSNTVNPSFIDAGYALQWNRTSLAPGETWNIIAYEIYTAPGDLQVLPPAPQQIPNNATTTLPFVVQNLGGSPLTVTLSTQPLPSGWTASIQGPTTRVIAANSSTDVSVNVTVTGVSGGGQATLGLTATDGSSTVTQSTQLTIAGGKTDQNPLVLGANASRVASGRSIILSVSGGNLPGPQQYAVTAFGHAQCFIKRTSNGQTILKTSGGVGACSVTASNPGNNQFNPITSNTIIITVY